MIGKKKLPLRIGVGAIVLNKENKVFVGKRIDNPVDKWQMPQGGVNDGEKLVDAMKRELHEETGIKNIELLKEIDGWSEYELPEYLLGKVWRGKYRGQKQKWFIVRFVGKEDEITQMHELENSKIKPKKPKSSMKIDRFSSMIYRPKRPRSGSCIRYESTIRSSRCSSSRKSSTLFTRSAQYRDRITLKSGSGSY